jgi:hypothetical protein
VNPEPRRKGDRVALDIKEKKEGKAKAKGKATGFTAKSRRRTRSIKRARHASRARQVAMDFEVGSKERGKRRLLD